MWITVSGMLLSFVFVFGGSLRNMYECVVFLFIVHPFDVGDQIVVGTQTDWCTVRLACPCSALPTNKGFEVAEATVTCDMLNCTLTLSFPTSPSAHVSAE